MNDLKPLYLENLQDIHHIINEEGNSLLHGMLSLQHTNGSPLSHSMHNTGQGKLKILLVKSTHSLAVIEQLGSIHEILYPKVPVPCHTNVFLPSARVALMSRQNNTISSCNYSSFANDLISTYTSHTLDNDTTSPPKRPRVVHLSYSAAVSTVSVTTPSTPKPTIAHSTVSSLTTQDLDALFERMKPYIRSEASSSNITIEELEDKMKHSHAEVLSIHEGLNTSIQDLSLRLETISSRMERQNSIILGMENNFKDTLSDFSTKLKELHDYIKKTSTPTSMAPTSKNVHWGGSPT